MAKERHTRSGTDGTSFKSNLLVKSFFLLNAAFAMAILDLISRLHVASFVTMIPECRRAEG
jgi:hypothetical protein